MICQLNLFDIIILPHHSKNARQHKREKKIASSHTRNCSHVSPHNIYVSVKTASHQWPEFKPVSASDIYLAISARNSTNEHIVILSYISSTTHKSTTKTTDFFKAYPYQHKPQYWNGFTCIASITSFHLHFHSIAKPALNFSGVPYAWSSHNPEPQPHEVNEWHYAR